MRKGWVLAAVLALAAADGAAAGGFGPVVGSGGGGAVTVSNAAPVSVRQFELLRRIQPQEGREVVVTTAAGGTVTTIEWSREVMVRARTRSGAPLSAADLSALRARFISCPAGSAPRNPREAVERSGTWELRLDCVRLQ